MLATRLLLVALGLSALSVPTSERADVGTVLSHCAPNLSERASADPLESYGIEPSPHNHTPAGAMAFNATTTVRQMLAANMSCTPRADHSMLWIPTPLRSDGLVANVSGLDTT
jgi:hypothetical protein